MEITKETVTDLIGTTEGFSAEAVKEQLDIRQKAVARQLQIFREANGIAIKGVNTK